jgi:LytS/YehU family sensor histidine kinase
MFWLLMITVSVEDNPGARWWEPILWEGSSALAASGWLWIALRTRDHFAPYLDRPLVWLGRHALWLPLVAATFIPAIYALRHGVYALLGQSYPHRPWPFLFVYETIKVTLYSGLWLGILFGLDSHAQWRLQQRRLADLQKALTEAQLAHLQAQLRPHFFFNVLNTISALMHVDVARADRLLAGLGDLLHLSLRAGERERVPLREELRTLELYAEMMQERFTDRVTIGWTVDPSIADALVPSLLLQPLLENAFKHGVERSSVPIHIEITARREGDALSLTVSNTGSTLAPDCREGVGLGNCRRRLAVIYGDAASLQLRGEAHGVAAQVAVPLTGVTA